MSAITKTKSVLISGGSIAGPATAFWLNKYGFKTTLVERWNGVRPGGQSVDLAHYGLEAIQRMNLEPEVRARFTGEKGTTITDAHNTPYMSLPVGHGPTNEFEILRGDFADMLYKQTEGQTEWIFNDYITSVEEPPTGQGGSNEGGGKVKVGFKSGKTEEYDYLIIAEGARSWTRKLVFEKDKVEYKPIGCYIAYFSIPLTSSTPYSDQWHVIYLPHKRCIYFRPDFKANTQRAGVMFLSPESKGYEKLSPTDQKQIIKEIYADGGENAQRMLEGLDTKESDDLYFEYLAQVHAQKWSSDSGRVFLVGDSAWCGTPMIGMGCSLSVAGSYILAGEMAKHHDHGDIKKIGEEYEKTWRPTVTEAQKLPPGIPRILFQESEWGVKTFLNFTTVMGWIFGSKLVQQWVIPSITRVWTRLFPSEEGKKLPDYNMYLVDKPTTDK
ncbi:hypothetical protein I302_106176 [Kwoniella bestiolae CBS 10118]|uniref:FAD-binding domain-containing protein n=1 Tax=Kwoniella bestiolae CBS 10118 TaxID=1296100 RepID=A0A1B9G398_9TREE|nr:hypothetical protein I302_05300 [Kwoniella bestiolae CBS 10118]OCF25480.1 hypothetical protein I302_05300 [Kwoniella bestiolae CBS 10118]